MPTPGPAKAPAIELPFGAALLEVAAGKKITRASWASAACLLLHASVLHLRNADGSLHVLQVSEGDIVASDWIVVREQ